jgi:hypothetical protein
VSTPRGIEEVVAAPPEAGQFLVDRVIRVILLLVIAAAGVSVLHVAQAPRRDQATFLQELRAGRVNTVAYDDQGGLHWSEGDWAWYRTRLDLSSPAFLQASADAAGVREEGQDTDGDGVADGSPFWGPPPAGRIRPALEYWQQEVPGDAVELRETRPGDGWRYWVIPGPLAAAASLAWLLSFLMAGLRLRNFASGWAWLLMLFLSPFGAALYLLLEPGPLWRQAGWAPGRRRLGVRHALLGLLLSYFVTSMLGL